MPHIANFLVLKQLAVCMGMNEESFRGLYNNLFKAIPHLKDGRLLSKKDRHAMTLADSCKYLR